MTTRGAKRGNQSIRPSGGVCVPVRFIDVRLFFSLVFATPLCCALFPQKR